MCCLPTAWFAALPWRRHPGLQLRRVVHRWHWSHSGRVSFIFISECLSSSRESHELTVTPLSVSYSFHQSVYVWMCRMLVHHTWVMQSKTWNASTREHNSNSARSLFSFTTSWSIDNITTLNSNLMSCSKVHLFKYFGMTKMSFWITSQSFRWIL